MAFYADLSEVYDALFPVSDAQRGLFEAILGTGEVRRVADAGCGTGAQLLPFASAGISCVGFDPDPHLVALARKSSRRFPASSWLSADSPIRPAWFPRRTTSSCAWEIRWFTSGRKKRAGSSRMPRPCCPAEGGS